MQGPLRSRFGWLDRWPCVTVSVLGAEQWGFGGRPRVTRPWQLGRECSVLRATALEPMFLHTAARSTHRDAFVRVDAVAVDARVNWREARWQRHVIIPSGIAGGQRALLDGQRFSARDVFG